MEYTRNGHPIAQRIRMRMALIQEIAADTVGGALQLQLLHWEEQTREFVFKASTTDWMRNVIGTLHGGSCAVMVDQAMGCVANCLFEDEPHAPTSQLQLNFHRPMIAGEDFMVHVRVVSVSRSMIHLSAEVYAEKAPDKLCVSASSVFFRGKKAE